MKGTFHRVVVGQDIPRIELEAILQDNGYEKKSFVTRPGEYAIRGGIFDIYPLTYRMPVRVEYEAETITSIHDFSPLDGKSLIQFDEFFVIPVNKTFEKKLKKLGKEYEQLEPIEETKHLQAGDYVVHLKYGIGRFLGTKRIQVDGQKRRHLAIEYANREILYLEMGELLERYIGGEGRPPRLTKLHSKEWERAKIRTRKAVSSVAEDLLKVQALRTVGKGFAFPKDHEWQKEFEAEFPFKETPDQLKAIAEVKRDMEKESPMDRLLAGDVGYGKTEVALRAAFKAITGGRQVAILVPTTVLAEQHYVVMKNRMKNYPVTVEVLSRFRARKEQKRILKSMEEGKTDIVVGTHRLLSRDVRFRNLGLLIIDEEQRFGVKHKEKLKTMRSALDIMTLTATPIPRTLYMSLVGVRDMSTIETAPENRLPIETYVLEYDDEKIREAFQVELSRGGQIYFVHNRVQSIDKVHRHLKKIMPHVRFGVAHGQMSADALENVMGQFLVERIDCLIATNIIESGIDIPNVNTIMINRADLFGLADLYQLRGRVGRFQEKRQAYAYFMVPKNWVMTGEAEKRLSAIQRFTELGSGFKIALEDLEIRGAGNLLGHQQSGFIHAVGFDLYCKMLRKAIENEKNKEKKPVR
ncbi:MAG: transcription-repair coupling factor [Candidatus Omnitrophica bacterium]|nr:transcription-repair coupling factor [Candidatus Omnitrophota bacterium]